MNQAHDATTPLRTEDELVLEHLGLARRLAARYASRGVELDDLVQVANLALIKAARGFKPERGAFPPFATATILGEIKKHFRDSSWTVRPPRRIQELQAQIVSATADHWQQHAAQPTVAWLSTALDVAAGDVREAQAADGCFHPGSLDQPVRGETTTIGELVPDSGDDPFAAVDALATVAPLIQSLPAEDRDLLSMRYVDELTQQQIADRTGVSQMQVSRRLKRVIDTLRAATDPISA